MTQQHDNLHQLVLGIIQEKVDNGEIEEVARACRELDDMVDADEQLGLSEVENGGTHYYTPRVEQGYETDEYGFPVWVKRELDGVEGDETQYFNKCRTPILECEASQNDRKQRNLEEVLPPNKQFYSVAKPYNKKERGRKHSNYMAWAKWLVEHQDNKPALQKAWKQFWRMWNHPTKGGFQWMDASHMKCIRNTFNKYGVSRQSK